MRLGNLAKPLFALAMAWLLLISTLGVSFGPQRQAYAADAAQSADAITVSEAIYEASRQILGGDAISDWEAIGLTRAGQTVPASYLSALEENVRSNGGSFSRVTDYARIVLGGTAVGADMTQFAGYNLVEKIYNNEKMTNQGLNGPVYGLLALDSGGYAIPDDAQWSRDKLVEQILSGQNADGGFSLVPGTSDPDLTGMALTALAPYTERADVKTAGERAVDWLAVNQQAHGGYNSWGADSSESVSQAIIALTAHGIDPAGERFVKNGVSLLDKLMTFRQSDGGFAHVLSGSTNGMATEQALAALVAYDLFTNGEGRLYDFVQPDPQPEPVPAVQATISVEGPEGTIAEEESVTAATALEALEKLNANHESVKLVVVNDPNYGKYVSSIGDIAAGKYGGYDGWQYVVRRDGQWVIPAVGMADFALKASDRIVVYYGDFNTQLIESIAVQPEQPKAEESFTVSVVKSAYDWLTNQPVLSPAADVQVAIGSTTAKTNSQGVATFADGLAAGTYTVSVTDYADNRAPGVVRSTKELVIAAKTTNSGSDGDSSKPAAKKITLSVVGDSVKGTILPATTMELQTGDTAYSVLVRKLGDKVQARGSGASLYVEAIDGLAEFDRGPQSGWMYSVNGSFPNESAGSRTLKDKDVVAWRYTTNSGVDIGARLPGSSSSSSGGGGGGGTSSSPAAQIESELGKLSLSADNTEPIGKVGKTTAVLNLAEKMSGPQAEQLRQELAAQTVALSKEASPSAQTEIKDRMEEVRLVVPAAALSDQVSIGVSEQPAERPELVSGLYEFAPDGTKFGKPVYMSIKIAVLTDTPDNLALAWLDETNDQWVPVPAVLDAKTGVMTGKVTHFTKFAVIDRSKLEAKPQYPSMAAEIGAVGRHILGGEALTDWEAFALARTGHPVPSTYLAQVEQQLQEQNGEFRKATDLERIALAVKAVGGDPTDIAGYNLIEKIYNHGKMTSQGTNGPVFALLALDSGNYSVPADAEWTTEKLIQWILQQQSESGGFPLVKGEDDNVDMTAMAVTALSAHLDRSEVKSAVDKAIDWLSRMQLDNGGYALFGEENCESASQVVIALASAGIYPKDARFAKAGGDLLGSLQRFKNADGGYAHTAGQASDEMATEQALMALAAYERFIQGQPKLFQLSAGSPSPAGKFVDEGAISSWATDAVYRAYEADLMTGISETELRFAPQQEMTRAQFAAIILRLIKESPAAGTEQAFADVHPDNWYFGYVMRAKELGIIEGASSSLFQPDRPVTRQEMAVMIARALHLEGGSPSEPFADQHEIDQEAVPYVNAVQERHIMEGYGGSFRPAATVTREMAAVVAVRVHDMISE